MDRPALPVALGLAFGLVVGAFRGFQQFAPAFFVNRGPTVTQVGVLVTAVGVVAFLVSPVAVTLAGYWLGGRVDLAREWTGVLALVGVAAFAGFLVGEGGLLAVGLVATAGVGPSVPPFTVVVAWQAVVGGVVLALYVFAGAAVRTFRQA